MHTPHTSLSRIVLGFALTAAFLGTSAVQAAGVAGPGAAKLDLVGPAAIVYCSTVEPFPGDDGGTAFPGFVVFNQDVDAGTVKATVSVKGWAADTTYPVRLIQGDSGDCYTVDGTIVTNGQGNGTLHIEEAKHPSATAMQVIIDTNVIFGNPTTRATELYELQ